MESTVVSQTAPDILSGNSVSFESRPVAGVWVPSSGEVKRSEVRSTLPAKGCSSLTAKKKSDENVLLIPHFKEFVAYLIASDIPEVQTVLISEERAQKLLHVYILTRGYDFDANEIIYDRQERVMHLFAGVDFDFHITPERRYSDPDLKVVFSR